MSAHELHWDPANSQLVIVCRHPDTPDANQGWRGYETGDEEDAALYASLSDEDRAGYEAEGFGRHDTLLDVLARDETIVFDGHTYRSDGSSIFRVSRWCGLHEDWISVSEMVDGAKWDGPPGTIPIAAITGWEFDDDYATVTRLAPIQPAALEAPRG